VFPFDARLQRTATDGDKNIKNPRCNAMELSVATWLDKDPSWPLDLQRHGSQPIVPAAEFPGVDITRMANEHTVKNTSGRRMKVWSTFRA
jgi:hypothetical protein